MVSVVIPAYNASEFVGECLESVAAQSVRDLEVIVVDDGSSDATASIVEAFARHDPRVRLLRVANGGVSRARNLGVEHARGRYITFVDADDALHPLALEAMLAVMERRGAEVCVTGFRKARAIGSLLSRARKERDRGLTAAMLRAELMPYERAMEVALYQKRLLNSPWGVLMERGRFLEAGGFRDGTRYEDLDAFYRLYEHAEAIAYMPYPFYLYRENPGSFLNNWSDSRLDVLDVTDRLLDFFRERYPALEPAAADRRFSAHYNMLLLMRRHGAGHPEAMERCRAVIRAGRLRALRDPRVRLKNKLGALLSFLIL
ncbi:MAG: glycosyltransferase family 2 protein [Muribaculaceae bacterium]|nr:glycosyltransferase family 2 protein [Muribaculaceae bacterium]